MALPPVVTKTPEERLDALELAKAASDAQMAALEKSNKELQEGLYMAASNQKSLTTMIQRIQSTLKLKLIT